MSSSSNCFFFILILVLLQFSSSLASTKHIDTVCSRSYVRDKTFCLKTLNAYPPAAAATSLSQLVDIVIGYGMSYTAEKSAGFFGKVATHGHTLKKQFKLCKESYETILFHLKQSVLDLRTDHPEVGFYDVNLCYDETQQVRVLVGKNRDKASKELMKMTLMMEKVLDIVLGATAGG